VTEVATAAPGSPYKGLARYEEADAPDFFGREADAELVTANLLAARLTLLFGESGVGKSSLLHAGVAPRLRALDDLVLVLHSDWRGDAAASLSAALRSAAGLGTGPPTTDLASTIAACAGPDGRDVIVVLDQFEEYFVYHPEDDDDAFSSELPRAVARDDLPASFLIAIREDALGRLERFKGRVPGLFDTYLRLNRLGRDAAREAIVAPLQRRAALAPAAAVTAEPALVEQVLDEVEAGRFALAGGGAGTLDGAGSARHAAERRIEAPYLQLVLMRLWEEERRAGSRVLRLEMLEQLGGAERIVRAHLDAALDALEPDEQEAAASVLRFLVTPSGTKIAHRVADLAEYAERPPAQVDAVLRKLAAGETRVVRPAGEDSYEIYHDVLAPAVLDWRARWLHARELAALERRRRRRLRVVIAGLVIAVAGGAAAAIAVWRTQSDRADAARRQAAAQALEVARAAPYYHAIYTGHRAPVNSVAFSPDGSRVVSADERGDVRVWTTADGHELAALHADGDVLEAAFSPGGAFVATASTNGEASVRRWADGGQVASLREPFGLDGVTFSPDGRLLALSGSDGTVRVWDWRGNRVVAVLDGQGGVVRSSAFSRDGSLVAAGSDDGGTRVWDWRRQRLLATLPTTPGSTVYAVVFSPDGRLVASGGQEARARIWDWRAQRVVWAKRVNDGYVDWVAFSPDGSVAAVATGDGVTRLWDWRRGRLAATLAAGADRSVAFSRDGCLVATAGYDRTARVWRPPLAGCRG
jgi:hypothetical protein